MKKLILLLIAIALINTSFAHSGKPKYHIIIDTDGAIDDMRAISMLLAGNDIRVLAITCSQGTLMPETSAMKVLKLLQAYHHEGIPIGIGKQTPAPLPPWNGFARETEWGKEGLSKSRTYSNAQKLLERSLSSYPEKVTLIALGSLKTYAEWLKQNKDRQDKIKRIIWYNNFTIDNDFNYIADTSAYKSIIASGIPLEIIGNTGSKLMCNDAYLSILDTTNSIYASHIHKVHQQPVVRRQINTHQLALWDDLVPLYLTAPMLFETKQRANIKECQLSSSFGPSIIYELISKLLTSSVTTNNRVFSSFPVKKNLYKKAYADIMDSTILNYGLEEWKAICLTNEIHGHTGIYSIIGAKMGIRAMEYFNVGVNNLDVVSFAGNKPPISCFNDGLQISTGSTLGQGLISIADTSLQMPSAIISFNHQFIKISLKENIILDLKQHIAYAIKKYGLLTDDYWKYIEETGVKYWKQADRHEIFTIETLVNEQTL